MAERIRTYREFWPHYLREHARPETRTLHYIGTALSSLALVAFLVSGQMWLIGLALISGYGPAWTAHFFLEHNRPATFRYPLWSLVSDYRMAMAWLSGRIDSELDRAGIAQR